MTRYEILEPFGTSLLGPYFKARDRELERFVLLWLLPPALFQDDGERRQCLRRAAAVAALQHPGLLPLHETGETGDGGVFQAFAWAEGETLARRLETGPLKPAVASDLTAQIAAGLDLAHGQGIVHGHLDPSGILVTTSGEAKLFDLSASPGERTWIGASGAPAAAWLAPEQRQGMAASVRSDVWGLGAMLYEMVTGARPRSGMQEPLRALRPDVSEDLERIAARALAPLPAGRYASAGDLRRALAGLSLSGSRPIAAGPGGPAIPPSGAEAGRRIGHYRLLEPLGGGGMGVVYRAEDTHLGRTVALKLLPPELVRDPVAKARFFQEARAASALEHPNVCTVYDAGEADDGRLWLAMPCYDGETLRSRLERGPLPVDEAVDVARQVARGLAKAHKQGIVHRDVKPANLMLTSDGVMKILDFGIAKLAGEVGLTRTGVAVGTPSYMSPEQAFGREVDHRTDLWALGVVLYEMLAGRRPFPGEHAAAVIEGILHREPEPLTKSRPEVPPEVEEIVRRLLAKDSAGRYASAEEVAGDLRSLLGPPSTAVARPPATGRSRWSFRAAGALLVLALAGGLAAWLLRPAERAGSGGEPKFMRLTDQQGIELFPALSPSGDFFVYAKRDGGDLDLFLQRVGGTQPLNLTAGSPADDSQPAYSPDGRSIAFRSERDGGGLFVMGATGESVRRLVDFGYQPAWSPDGREIACSTASVTDPLTRNSRGEIRIVDVATGRFRLLVPGDAVQPSWSPDGSRIAYWSVSPGTGKRSILTISSDGLGTAVHLTHETDVDWSPVWSPQGQVYFSSNRSGSMNLWRISVDERTGKPRSEPEPVSIPAQWAGFPSLSSDGSSLVYATREKTVNLERVRLDPDPSVPRLLGEPEPVTRGTSVFNYASVSPDGEWIVLSLFGDREDLTVVHRDGGALRRLMDDGFRDRVGVWAPDGRILFYSDRQGRYNAWSIEADGSDLRPLIAGEKEVVYHPVASPDGRSVSVCGGATGGAIIDLTRPLEQRRAVRLPGSPWGPFCPNSWSRDGERLVGQVAGSMVSFSLRTRRHENLGSGRMPLWMADGERLLFGDQESALWMLDTRTRETRLLLRPPRDSSYEGFALSSDNRWLYLLRGTEEGDLWMSY